MQFDVIVSNPPYQLRDGGYGASAIPIYHRFVQQAKKLQPRFLSMIVPSRWYAGGRGLDDFRSEMLHDEHLREIHDYPDATTVFPSVQITGGVCFFLWKRDEPGKKCKVVSNNPVTGVSVKARPLLEQDAKIFIRFNEAVPILRKVKAKQEATIQAQISPRKPFGFRTYFKGKNEPFPDSVKLYQNGGIGYVAASDIESNAELVSKWKVLLPRAGGGSDASAHLVLGKPFIGEPGSACTETYIVAGAYDTRKEAEALASYIRTRFFRFLVLLAKPSQDAPARAYQLVPQQDFSKPWTDEELYKKYGLTKDEIAFIESMVRPMEPNGK